MGGLGAIQLLSLLLAAAGPCFAEETCTLGKGQLESAALLQSASKKRKVIVAEQPTEAPGKLPDAVNASGPPLDTNNASGALFSGNVSNATSGHLGILHQRGLLLLRQIAASGSLHEAAALPPTFLVLALLVLLCFLGAGAFILAGQVPGFAQRQEALRAPEGSPWAKPQGLASRQRLSKSRDATSLVAKSQSQLPAPRSNAMAASSSQRQMPEVVTPSPSILSLEPRGVVGLSAEPDAGPGSFLCPGLVVPEECECSLLVPRLQPQNFVNEVTIDDAAQVPVFRVMYSLPSRSDSIGGATALAASKGVEQDGNRCLILSTADDHTVFAFCRLGFNGALTILDAKEKPFGLIRARAGRSGYEVATRLGLQIHVGLNQSQDLAVIDRRGRTLALTQPLPGDGLNRMLRIGPWVDAGLITLAVMAVDLLECSELIG